MIDEILALGRAAKVALVDQLLPVLAELDRASIIQSLEELEKAGLCWMQNYLIRQIDDG